MKKESFFIWFTVFLVLSSFLFYFYNISKDKQSLEISKDKPELGQVDNSTKNSKALFTKKIQKQLVEKNYAVQDIKKLKGKLPKLLKEADYYFKSTKSLLMEALNLVPVKDKSKLDNFIKNSKGFEVNRFGNLALDEKLRSYFDLMFMNVASLEGKVKATARVLTELEKLSENLQAQAGDVLIRYLNSIQAENDFSNNIVPELYGDQLKDLSLKNINDYKEHAEISYQIEQDKQHIRSKFLGEELNMMFYGRDIEIKYLNHQAYKVSINNSMSIDKKIENILDIYKIDKGDSRYKSMYFNLDQRFISNNKDLDESKKKQLRAKFFGDVWP